MKPAYILALNGTDLSPKGREVIVSITASEHAGHKADTLEVELDDMKDITPPAPGSILKLWLGYAPQPIEIGTYKVNAWTKRGPRRTLHVSATAAELTTDIRAAKVRSWHDQTVGAIVNKIAAEHGLIATVDSEIASRLIAHFDQQHESNLGFLSRLAQRNGANFKLANGQIILSKKGSTLLPDGRTKPNFTLTPDMVSTWTATSQNRGNYNSVVTEYADHKAGKRGHHREGSGSPTHRVRVLHATKDEAKRAARVTLNDLKRSTANLEVEGPGLPTVFADSLLTAKGFAPAVDGEYLVKSVVHTLENGGFKTTISAELAGQDTAGDTDGNDADSADDTSGDTTIGDTEANP